MELEGFTCLADVEETAVEWLWPGRIPLGELTIVEGDPGVNKSSVCCDLAARLTRGIAMPNTTAQGRPRKGGVIFLIGEDSVPQTVIPRLQAAGATWPRSMSQKVTLRFPAISTELKRRSCAKREARGHRHDYGFRQQLFTE